MIIIRKNLFYFIAILSFTQIAFTQAIEIELKSNKSEYVCGEPILLKTTISNKSSETFIGNVTDFGLGYRTGFSLFFSYENEDYIDILDSKKQLSLYIVYRTGFGVDEYFQDRHWIEKTLQGGQTVERLDMWGFKKVGKYRLKAVLKERDGSMRESKPIAIRVLSLEDKPDSISKVGDQDFLIRLGKALCKAHYTEYSFSGLGTTVLENSSQEYTDQISSKIIDECQDSVFREYVMYADILSHRRAETSTHELIEGRKESALRFEKEYPDSWLLPEIYRKLFNTYVAEKAVVKAEEYLDKALEKAPNATVLRYVRDKGPNLLNEIRQESGQLEQPERPEANKPLALVIPVTIAAFAGLCVIGGIFLFKKKSTNKEQ